MSITRFLGALVGALMIAVPAWAQTIPTVSAYQARMAAGVNVHMNYGGTYGDANAIGAGLDYLRGSGTITFRDNSPQNDGAALTVLCQHGGLLDLLIQSGGGLNLQSDVPNVDIPWIKANRSCAAYLEGPNEFDGSSAPINGIVPNSSAQAAIQAGLWAMQFIRTQRDGAGLSAIPIIGPTYWTPDGSMAQVIKGMASGGVTTYINLSAFHPYTNPQSGFYPADAVAQGLTYAAMGGPGLPIAFTEEGVCTGHVGATWCAAPDAQAAQWLTNYFSGAVIEHGVRLVTWYELEDEAPGGGAGEGTFGLFSNHQPKAQATALRTLWGLIYDAAPIATVVPLTATVAGASSGTHLAAVQYHDGSYGLAAWNERGSDKLTLTFGQTFGSIVQTDVVSGSSKTLTAGNTITLTTGSAQQFVRLSVPAGSPTPPVVTPPVVTPPVVATAPLVVATAIACPDTVVGSMPVCSVTVQNQGTAATPAGVPIGVAFAEGTAQTEVAWNDTTLGPLAPGASATLKIVNGPGAGDVNNWQAAAGTYPVVATVNDIGRYPGGASSISGSITITAPPPVVTPPVVTPPTPSKPQTSANGATISGTSGVLIDGLGNRWTLVSTRDRGLVAEMNGQPAAFSANIRVLEYKSGRVHHQNTGGAWYYWTGTTWLAEGRP